MSYLILIADDNVDNILLIKRILKRSSLNLEFMDAETGRDAIELAMRRKPDLILLDMKMPNMNGYEAAAALRLSEGTNTIPIIAVTAQAMLGDKERALQAGCNEYLTKPLDPILLIDTVKRYLAGKSDGENDEKK
ncbi:MAG TPA: response regulator [Candidatus Acidoferrales bacterium]|nr:response regulator [Candidatus Acidoferrales bacterium]